MPADPAGLEHYFESRGGFETVYKKLIGVAIALLQVYGSDSNARVALRQLDPEELVNHAFMRLYDEGPKPDEEPYHTLRNHIRNYIYTVAKSPKEANTARVDGDDSMTQKYLQQEDRNEQTVVERLMIIDDIEFCTTVVKRVADGAKGKKGDKEVAEITDAIIIGFREPAEIREITNMDQRTFDSAWKRLIRRFGQAQAEVQKEENENRRPSRSL